MFELRIEGICTSESLCDCRAVSNFGFVNYGPMYQMAQSSLSIVSSDMAVFWWSETGSEETFKMPFRGSLTRIRSPVNSARDASI